MGKSIRYVGLDVHADTIAVAICEGGGEGRSLGTIPNRPEPIRKLVKRLEPISTLRVCYEAGPTGYALYWQLAGLGVKCEVVAPTLVPVKAGDRVKTDRRDAEKLARSYRSGDLTAVWVPDAAHEALRDVVRAREAAKKDDIRRPPPGRSRGAALFAGERRRVAGERRQAVIGRIAGVGHRLEREADPQGSAAADRGDVLAVPLRKTERACDALVGHVAALAEGDVAGEEGGASGVVERRLDVRNRLTAERRAAEAAVRSDAGGGHLRVDREQPFAESGRNQRELLGRRERGTFETGRRSAVRDRVGRDRGVGGRGVGAHATFSRGLAKRARQLGGQSIRRAGNRCRRRRAGGAAPEWPHQEQRQKGGAAATVSSVSHIGMNNMTTRVPRVIRVAVSPRRGASNSGGPPRLYAGLGQAQTL